MKTRIILLICVLALNSLKAQDVMNTFVNNYIQPPPDIAALGKYIDFPVGYYTGTPQINIPIYTLKDGAVNIPISLDYHSGGITVSELATSVGLGWALNAGGMVMRTVRGAPDEGTAKQAGDGGAYPYPRGYYLDKGLSKMTPLNANDNSLWSYLNPNIAGGMAGYNDFEPDLYFFNFNGHTGKFVFDENQNPVLLNDDNLKIQALMVSGTFQWIITTDDGAQYFFGENQTFTQCSPTLQDYDSGNSGDADAIAPSNWYLTRIVYPNSKDTAYFNYTKETYNYYDLPACQQMFNTVISQGANFQNIQDLFYACGGPGQRRNILFSAPQTYRLSAITTRNYSVKFIAMHSRADLINIPSQPAPCMLDSIEVFNSSGQCMKRLSLVHSYFYSSPNTGVNTTVLQTVMRTDATDTKRLKLVSLTEFSGDGSQQKNPYVFTYQESVPLPRRISFDQDHWGYSNNSAGNSNGSFFPFVQYPACQAAVFPGANRNPKWPEMSGFSLTTITDPLGALTSFEFEPDSGSYRGGPQQVGGGMRIHKITVFDNVTAIAKVRSFYYGGSGVIYHLPKYLWDLNNEYYQEVGVSFRGYLANPTSKFIFTATQSIVPLQDLQGNNIGYSTVRETFGANGEGGSKVYNYQATEPIIQNSRLDQSNFATYAATAPVNAGGIAGIYPNGHFNDIAPQNLTYYAGTDVDNYFPAAPDQLSYARGNLNSIYTYDSSGNLIDSTHNNYAIILHENYLIRGYKVNAMAHVVNGVVAGGPPTDVAHTFYKLHAGISHLASTTHTEYRNGQSMTTTHSYGYESAYHTLQTSDTVVSSMGDQIIKKTYYSFDYSPSATTDGIFGKAIAVNFLVPVTKEIWKNNLLISDTVTRLADFAASGPGNLIRADTIYTLQTSTPLNFIQAGESIALTGQLPALLPNPYLLPRSSFNYNGINGKITQQQLINNEIQSLVWDNQYDFPLARVENAALADIAYTSFESAETGNWNLSDGTKDVGQSFTGAQSYDLTSSKNIGASVTGGKTYTVSYWSKNGPVTVSSNGSVITPAISGPVRKGWTYYEYLLPITTTAVSITTTGTATIDELRLYPSAAQMSTYTYAPLVGLTSQCDMNNKVTYYEYDGLLRLKDIRDQDGNILKTFDYHYHGQ